MLRSVLNSFDCKIIEKIAISCNGGKDEWVWHCVNSRRFSVRYAYSEMVKFLSRSYSNLVSSSISPSSKLWRSVFFNRSCVPMHWQLKIIFRDVDVVFLLYALGASLMLKMESICFLNVNLLLKFGRSVGVLFMFIQMVLCW